MLAELQFTKVYFATELSMSIDVWGIPVLHLHGSLIYHIYIYPKDIFVCQDAESRAEYGEMNVQRIHLQIDQLEDELIGQKQKCKAINDELQQTFNDMVEQY